MPARLSASALIRVVLAVDQALVPRARGFLGLEGNIESVARAAAGQEALALINCRPGVLATAIEMPKRSVWPSTVIKREL